MARLRGFVHWLVLLSSGACLAIMFAALGPVLPPMAAAFDAHGTALGGSFAAQLMMTMPGLGIIVSGPLNGWLAERIGARVLLLWGYAGFAAAGAAGLVTTEPLLLIAARFLVGCSAGAIATAAFILIGAAYDEAGRARMLGFNNAGSALIGTAVLLLSGGLAEAGGWRAPFALFLVSLPLLAGAAWVIRRRPERGPGPTRGSNRELVPLLPFYLAIVALFAAVFMGSVQMSFLMAARGIDSPALASQVLAANAFSTLAGSLLYGGLRARLGGERTWVAALLAMGVGLTGVGLANDLLQVAAGAAVLGFGVGLMVPQANLMILNRAPEAARGQAIGLMGSAIYLGEFLNPLLVAPLRQALSIEGAFIAVGAVLVLAAVVMALRGRGAVAA